MNFTLLHKKKKYSFVISFILSLSCFGQNTIQGKIINQLNNEAIPFAHIIYNKDKQGVISDLEGKFLIKSKNISFLKISAIGFQPIEIALDSLIELPTRIQLIPSTYMLPEAIVNPGINPAHRIIKLAVNNKNQNHPEKNRQFTSINYDKFTYYYKTDSLSKNHPALNGSKEKHEFTRKDSSIYDFVTELNDNYFFIKETVSKKYFKSTQKQKEIIILNRNSGFTNPATVILASQLQDFSFYKPIFTILNQQFVNPISIGSTSRYFFELKDTLFNEQGDSTFIIFFRPHKGKNFSGLEGYIHINSKNYAIQNVIAENVEAENIAIKFQQTYQLINNELWFPKQLFIDFSILGIIPWNPPQWAPVLSGSGQTFIDSVSINPSFKNISFSELTIAFEDTFKANENFKNFARYRPSPITEKEINSYSYVDSIGAEMNWDLIFDLSESLTYGRLPIGYFEWDILKSIENNEYEGTLLGGGLYTNPKLSNYFSVGGYFQYGLNDKEEKFGASIDLWFNHKKQTGLRFEISDDLPIQGGYNFLETSDIIGKNFQRMYSQTSFFRLKELKGSLKTNPIKYFTVNPYFAYQQYFTLDNYLYNNTLINNKPLISYGIDLRYAFGEKFTETNRGYFSEGTKFPIISFSFNKTKTYKDNSINRNRYLLKIDDDFSTVYTGKTTISMEFGYQTGNAPLPLNFSAPGNYNFFSLASLNSFETMKPAEFFSEEFVHVFLEQDLGTLLIKNKWMKPLFVFSQHIGFGQMHNTVLHSNVSYKTYEKGYFESGIQVKNMLNWKILGLGFGGYYRYGQYSNTRIKENIALKFSLNILID